MVANVVSMNHTGDKRSFADLFLTIKERKCNMPRVRKETADELLFRCAANMTDQGVMDEDRYTRHDMYDGGAVKQKSYDEDNMVECRYKGSVFHIPNKLFLSVLLRSQVNEKKYVRYKEGAKIYSMSEREFNRLAHDAGAVYKRNKMALVKIDIIDKYLEYFKE